MFVDAIERVEKFTRPLQSIMRLYGHDEVVPGSATLFFVNEEGCAVTCKHVAELILQEQKINDHYKNFLQDRRTLPRDNHYPKHLQLLEERYKLQAESVIGLSNQLYKCADRIPSIHIDSHPTYDLAIVRLQGYTQLLYRSYAVFARNAESIIRSGRSLCRLGYPFPDFTNFRYNMEMDRIEWTELGRKDSVRFPIDGIVTRLMADPDGTISGVEMSTPGLKGQSGGPLFDVQGLICGMQSATRHLHLGFDIEGREVLVNNRKTKVSNYPFLNVGLCVHANVIKRFLREKGVRFYEA